MKEMYSILPLKMQTAMELCPYIVSDMKLVKPIRGFTL